MHALSLPVDGIAVPITCSETGLQTCHTFSPGETGPCCCKIVLTLHTQRCLQCSCLTRLCCGRLRCGMLRRFGKRMMSWSRRQPEELAPVQEDGQDDYEMGDASPPADAGADLAASGTASPARSHAGDEHTLRERYTDKGKSNSPLASEAEHEPSQPTLTAAAKDVPLQPSAPVFSPFAAMAGSALDTAEEDDLEVGIVHERPPSGKS